MSPVIAGYVILGSSMFVAVDIKREEGGVKRIGAILYSRFHFSELRRVLLAGYEGEDSVKTLVDDMARVTFSDDSMEGMLLLGGKSPETLHGLVAFMKAYEQTGLPTHIPRMDVAPRVCCLLTPNDRSAPEGMFGYVDRQRAHHFYIFFSKRDGQDLVHASGVSITEQKMAEEVLDHCGLPLEILGPTSIHLSGEIAQYFNQAQELKRHTNRDVN